MSRFVPNQGRIVPSSRSGGGGGFLGQLIDLATTGTRTQAHLAMKQAESDIETDAHLKRTSHEYAASELLKEGDWDRAHRAHEYMRERHEENGLPYLPSDWGPGSASAAAYGAAAPQIWRDTRDQGTSAGTIPDNDNDNDNSNPNPNPKDAVGPQAPEPKPSFEDLDSALAGGHMHPAAAFDLNPEYKENLYQRHLAENPRLTRGQFGSIYKTNFKKFVSDVPISGSPVKMYEPEAPKQYKLPGMGGNTPPTNP